MLMEQFIEENSEEPPSTVCWMNSISPFLFLVFLCAGFVSPHFLRGGVEESSVQ